VVTCWVVGPGVSMCNASSMTVGGGGDAGTWDFFVSYTQVDRGWAEWVAWELEESGFRVLVQAWDFVPGVNWVQRMREGVAGAERTIAVLSPAYLASQFGTAEWTAAWSKDPLGVDRKLLTIRVADCERPDLLANVASFDLFGLAEAEAKSRLRRLVTGAVVGRLKPASPPPFPGSGGSRAFSRPVAFPGAMPAVWNVAARHPNFVGRGRDLAVLRSGLAAGSRVAVRSLFGMGGVGKTQLANEYAYGQAGDYDAVWWLRAEEPVLLADQFVQLGRALGVEIEAGADPEQVRAVVHAVLRDVPAWLLVFDNADDVAGIADWLPAVPLGVGRRGHVLVTTRRTGFGALGQVHELDVIDPPEAVALLRTRVPELGEEVAAAIAEQVGWLPLALEQASAYLENTRIPAGEYLDLLRDRIGDLMYSVEELGSAAESVERNRSLARLWEASFNKVTEIDPAAGQLLDMCAYLAAEPIPLDLFTAHPDLLPDCLSSVAGDRLRFNKTVGTLVSYSLAKRSDQGLQLHRLVQAALRVRHAHPGQQ
jgi:hypothetical protein